MTYRILKRFEYNTDGLGIRSALAAPGEVKSDIPDALIPGLEAEGYIERADGKPAPEPEAKSIQAAPENKAIESAPENKDEPEDELKALRAEYREAFGKNPGPRWDADRIREELAKA